MTLRLDHAGWEVILQPALGGSVVACRHGGDDILRAAVAGADHPLMTSCFPLVPYANRIADGRFTLDGETHALPRNASGQAHPLHGVGWLRAWSVEHADPSNATLAHSHNADVHWPWSYRAEQRFALTERALTIALSVTNADDRAMPVSLGLHPYFSKAGVTRLRFAADGVWLTDARVLPTERVEADRLGDWAGGDSIDRASLIDNSYTGWSGTADIARETGDLRLSGDGTPILHLFMPPGEDFFCAEPVSAMPDAFNRTDPAMLQPGEHHAIAMTIEVGPA